MDINVSQNKLEHIEYFHKYNNIDNNFTLSHAFQIDSHKKGIHIVFVGGLHGNESVGVESAIWFNNLIQSQNLQLHSGKITFILGNPQAYYSGERFIAQNMNRVFLNTFEENIESLRAKEIVEFLYHSGVDYLIDFHSVSIGDLQILCYGRNPVNTPLLEGLKINQHFIVTEKDIPGTLALYCNELNIGAVAIECGNHNSTNALAIAKDTLITTLRKFNIIDDSFISQINFIGMKYSETTMKIYNSIAPIKPSAGFKFVTEQIETDYKLKKDQLYAISDTQKYYAPQDCVLFLPDRNPKPTDHDAGFLADLQIH
jgi:succinylglutamate desuccinylase